MRVHSVMVKADVTPYAIFSEVDLPKGFGKTGGGDVKRRKYGLTVSLETYARLDGAVYACGSFSLPSSQFKIFIEKENTDEDDTLIPLPKFSGLTTRKTTAKTSSTTFLRLLPRCRKTNARIATLLSAFCLPRWRPFDWRNEH